MMSTGVQLILVFNDVHSFTSVLVGSLATSLVIRGVN